MDELVSNPITPVGAGKAAIESPNEQQPGVQPQTANANGTTFTTTPIDDKAANTWNNAQPTMGQVPHVEIRLTDENVKTNLSNPAAKASQSKLREMAKSFFAKIFGSSKKPQEEKATLKHPEVDISKSTWKQTSGIEKLFQESSIAETYFNESIKEGNMANAANALVNMDPAKALELVKKQEGSTELGKEIGHKLATGSETEKEAAKKLGEKIIEYGVEKATDKGSLFRSAGITPGFLAGATEALVPEQNKTIIRDIVSSLPPESYITEPTPNTNEQKRVEPPKQEEVKRRVQQGLTNIAKSTENLPAALHDVNKILYKEVNKKFGEEVAKSQVVGGNYMLRFANPILMNPNNASVAQRKNQTIIAKIMQNIPNKVLPGNKEPYMSFADPLINAQQTTNAQEIIFKNLMGQS